MTAPSPSARPFPERALVERTARLFEAGSYPDKDLEVSPGQLDEMAGSFSDPVPIRIEHRAGPLRLGWLVSVWRQGRALFGKLAFTKAAWALLKESNARSLSLAIERKTLRIREVSLVSRPRVAGARVFSDAAVALFSAELPPEAEDKEPETLPTAESAALAELSRLTSEIRARDARDELNALMAAGKVAPAAEGPALALLAAAGETIRFADGDVSVADLFRRFLSAQPPVVLLGEMVPAGDPAAAAPGDMRLFELLGITPEEAARYAAAREGKENI